MIKNFKFTDIDAGWNMSGAHPMKTSEFGRLCLLVGLSGAGKSRTLRALNSVARWGVGKVKTSFGIDWTVEVQDGDNKYDWCATTYEKGDPNDENDAASFKTEKLQLNGNKLIERREDGSISLSGKPDIIGLKTTESIVSLFSGDGRIGPFYDALLRVNFSRPDHLLLYRLRSPRMFSEKLRGKLSNLQHLRESDVSLVLKAAALQRFHENEFRLLSDRYQEIFPSVERIEFDRLSSFRTTGEPKLTDPEGVEAVDSHDFVVAAIKESGVKGWVTSFELSSGMHRTLVHLLELLLAPVGSVFLIDELENSLGVNCLEPVTELLIDTERDIQIIATSHHPYIIGNVPIEHWRIVQRTGGSVRLVSPDVIPRLQTRSHQDAFIQLMNAKEYLEGIQ